MGGDGGKGWVTMGDGGYGGRGRNGGNAEERERRKDIEGKSGGVGK